MLPRALPVGGADAVGYTLYVGSPAQDRDIAQLVGVRDEAEGLGIPVIVWAYPRGPFAKQRGGLESPYNVEYAARVAQEVGADNVKVTMPQVGDASREGGAAPYDQMPLTPEEAARRVVRAAGRTLVLFSGGGRIGEPAVIAKVRTAMAAGATGVIFGRNVWQRPWEEAVRLGEAFRRLLGQA